VQIPRPVAGDLSANARDNSSPSSGSSTGKQESPATPQVFPYIYRWHRMGRKGQPCAVLVRSKINSCLVKFEDGFTAVTSHNALRRRKIGEELW
jgi:hypothetical protein